METTCTNSEQPEPAKPSETALSNGFESYETQAEMLQSWQERMTALANEMQSFGFASVFLASGVDLLLEQEERVTDRLSIRRGNYYACLGMLVDGAHEMKTRDS